MIPREFDCARPGVLEEALALLAEPETKAVAGGLSLIPLIEQGLAAPAKLVDLGGLEPLRLIREEDGFLAIGALATHHELEMSPLVRAHCPLLAEAAAHIGDVQVRAAGTLGGSLAHGDPAADYPAALLALEANVQLASAAGPRTLPIARFLLDGFATALQPGELLTGITIPLDSPGAGASYQKCPHPASGFALVGVAVRLRRDNGKAGVARVGITGLAGRAFRATAVERLIEGTECSPADIRKAAAAAADGVEPAPDPAASADYRAHLACVYAVRALSHAVARLA